MEHSSVQNFNSEKKSFLSHYRPSTKRRRTIDKNKNLNYQLLLS